MNKYNENSKQSIKDGFKAGYLEEEMLSTVVLLCLQPLFMLFYNLARTTIHIPVSRLQRMTRHMASPSVNGSSNGISKRLSLAELPKSNVFTSNLPADAKFPAPEDSYNASRKDLGPRMVKNALYTYVRPEKKEEPELYGVSLQAMEDLGLKESEKDTEDFKSLVSGNKIMWDPKTKEGIYPWAQCYGGWQFGSWAGQLGDGRAISLFESTNPETNVRYEVQLKGAGLTPYSRFADGKAVVRSSVREFVVSEALNGLKIPSTRALSLTLTRKTKVVRERLEPGAIVCRFAQTWLRIGTYDILRARGDRANIRRLSDYLLTHVFANHTFPSSPLPEPPSSFASSSESPQLEEPLHINRYTTLYRHIVLLNARTVAAWQAYGFTNGVLNTDNTSLFGLSLDFGPFAFIDNFDPSYTPNHDDHMLRYSYRNQPSIIWWNLVRLGEDLGELLGSGPRVDDPDFVTQGVSSSWAPELVARAERIIASVGQEYQSVFLDEYKRLLSQRLGLKTVKESDFEDLLSALLDTMEALELDFSHFFRRLSSLPLAAIASAEQRMEKAALFFHAEGPTGLGSQNEASAREKVAVWLGRWRARVIEDWGSDSPEGVEEVEEWDGERQAAMRRMNPKFVPRGWVLDEVIRKVEKEEDKGVVERIMRMVRDPFRESWAEEGMGGGGLSVEEQRAEEERWCGEVPRTERGIMCSCSS